MTKARQAIPLAERIRRAIRVSGPMALADYMHLCSVDSAGGYYSRRAAIGASGDFVTAPRVSQIFGELIGVWCTAAWQLLGKPTPFSLVEAGPGDGTMMSDLLRAATSVSGFLDGARVELIETSPLLKERHANLLRSSGVEAGWISSLNQIRERPFILVANEFLDVLPIRQFVKTGSAWRERCIAMDEGSKLVWALGTRLADPNDLPPDAVDAREGSILEVAPARNAWIFQLAEKIASSGGAALLIDYGYRASALGDTFQAVAKHEFADPLAEPGYADLTAHVDFARLGEAVAAAGASNSPVVTQGEFLMAMGLSHRVERLCAGKPSHVQEKIREGAKRLAAPPAMGDLFKVVAICNPRDCGRFADLPPFSAKPGD